MIEIWKEENPRKNLDSLMANFQKAAMGASSPPADQMNRIFELFTRIEQAPNPASRVTLDTEKDALGVRNNSPLGIDIV